MIKYAEVASMMKKRAEFSDYVTNGAIGSGIGAGLGALIGGPGRRLKGAVAGGVAGGITGLGLTAMNNRNKAEIAKLNQTVGDQGKQIGDMRNELTDAKIRNNELETRSELALADYNELTDEEDKRVEDLMYGEWGIINKLRAGREMRQKARKLLPEDGQRLWNKVPYGMLLDSKYNLTQKERDLIAMLLSREPGILEKLHGLGGLRAQFQAGQNGGAGK